MNVKPGNPYPLGATWDGQGVNFSIFSERATVVDRTLSQIKMIAEPWDVGPGGYQVGNFPIRWAEWSGRYRDSMRAFWRGDGGITSELAYRLTGSSDIYENDGRAPYMSIRKLRP